MQRQISEHLRAEIVGGKLPVGTKLPTAVELAVSWGVSTCTVHNALTTLVKAGLLKRQRGMGTFVAEPKRKLKCAAIYCSQDFWDASDMSFYQLLYRAVQAEFRHLGADTRFIIDSRAKEEHGSVYPPLLDAIQAGEVQALVHWLGNRSITPTLLRLPVPLAFLTGGLSIPHNVLLDSRHFLELAMDRLKREGCRSVGVISNMAVENEDEGHSPFHTDFVEVAGERGLEIRNSWIRSGARHALGSGKYERFGYDSFQAIWSQRKRPEGLIILPDMVVRGALTAIAERRVSVPGDLVLALHRNEGIDIPCPFPAFWITARPTEVARALVRQIERQFRGEAPELIRIPFHAE